MDILVSAISALINIPFKIYKFICDKFFTLDTSKLGPVFVTGCDSGFGHLLAIKLIQNGITTFAGCLTEAGEAELLQAAGRGPGTLLTVSLDVTDQESVDSAVQFVKKTLGPGKGLWGLVNNAGTLGRSAPDDWLTVDAYQRAMDVNFLGVVRVTQAFKPLIKLERGRIVTVTSIFGRIAASSCGPYCASKYAAEAYCDSIRRELTRFGVSVHILEPGFFATNLTKPESIAPVLTELWDELAPEVKEEYGEDYIKETIANLKSNLPPLCSTNLSLVVDAYYNALTSSCPKLRYYCGMDSKLFYIPLSMLPGFLQDWILGLLMNMNGVPVPKAAMKN